MRFLARIGLAVCGLALAPTVMVKADDAAVPPPSDTAVPQTAQAAGHHHKGLFGWRHCVECQRAWAKRHDGVDVPPPPSTPAAAMAGSIVHDHNHASGCAVCQAGTIVSGPISVVESYPPGHAMVGGPTLAGGLPPGYAVAGGGGPPMAAGDPTPVGVSRAGMTQWNNPRLASMPARGGVASYDPSVMPSSMIPAQTALDSQTTTRPHILGHLFGIGGISRRIRESRDDKGREAHASIAYDSPSHPVNELPAAVVYGKGH